MVTAYRKSKWHTNIGLWIDDHLSMAHHIAHPVNQHITQVLQLTDLVPDGNGSIKIHCTGPCYIKARLYQFLVTDFMLIALRVIFLFHRVIIEAYCIKIIPEKEKYMSKSHILT